MYELELKNLGLSEKEAKIYLAALELGPETAQNLSKKSGINRATTYVQIETLKKKGLMSEFEKGKKTFYASESPERLLSLLNIFEKDLNFKRTELNRIIPTLKELFSGAGERPKVRFFEGVEGTKAMRDELLKTKSQEILGFTNLDNLFKEIPNYNEEFEKKRIQQNIKIFSIYTRASGPIQQATDPKKLREAKFVSTERLPLKADITIDSNKIAIFAYSTKPVGVIIDSPEIAQTCRALFKFIWEVL